MNGNLNCNRKIKMMWLVVLAAIGLAQASAQVLTGDQAKKVAPTSFFFAGQSAAVAQEGTPSAHFQSGQTRITQSIR
ncbi:MAG: hypothetical protein WCA13_11435 [Terriglobales bacterium]